MHKVSNVGIFVFVKFEKKLDTVISQLNFNLMDHNKSNLEFTLIQLLAITNLFPLEIVQ